MQLVFLLEEKQARSAGKCLLIVSSSLAPRSIPKSGPTSGAKQSGYDAKTRPGIPGYLDAIATNLAGTNPSAFTLAAIDKSSGTLVFVGCICKGN